MATGVRVSSESIEAYQNIKLGKKQKYIVFCVNDSKTEIIVDKALSGKQIEKYNDFVDLLPQKEPRWAVYDFQFEADGGGQRNKLVLIKWPDDAGIRPKMLYAGSNDELRKSLDGIAVEVQATDYDEVAYENVLAKAKQGTR
ncbi:hypothetical protein AGABI2DRAFT_223913 [Agaricus bisporus var. bisporus H97]|uniref:hypothetical protein n=1 Tax=Agaricus bisporus var. bisporus (strain H97 / ATCC MYA-4626 / FGSC 10389) TaxID=936046 RepID=UPI00029F7846|nr:hypothetical protein AGABI2DRAFT_223913 [Agaricus bisporus var. bisporus H97]EKV45709.1 hypothetical protein AGABI2DRAFT_223913 [Agaricus bisporus var. bisporus H97]